MCAWHGLLIIVIATIEYLNFVHRYAATVEYLKLIQGLALMLNATGYKTRTNHLSHHTPLAAAARLNSPLPRPQPPSP